MTIVNPFSSKLHVHPQHLGNSVCTFKVGSERLFTNELRAAWLNPLYLQMFVLYLSCFYIYDLQFTKTQKREGPPGNYFCGGPC